MKHVPAPVPASRIVGIATERRRRSLALVDVLVGHAAALHRDELTGWRLEAVLVTSTNRLHGDDVVALRAAPTGTLDTTDLIPIDEQLLADLGARIVAVVDDVARVVADVACPAPPVVPAAEAQGAADVSFPSWWADEPRSA